MKYRNLKPTEFKWKRNKWGTIPKKRACSCGACKMMQEHEQCERTKSHRWYDMDDIYEKCLVCRHMRLRRFSEFSAIHVKKEGD